MAASTFGRISESRVGWIMGLVPNREPAHVGTQPTHGRKDPTDAGKKPSHMGKGTRTPNKGVWDPRETPHM